MELDGKVALVTGAGSRPGGRPGGFGGEPLEQYYAREVIGGPGAFVEVADETRPFALAARRKLLTEVAGRTSPGWRYATRSHPTRQNDP